MRQLSLKCYGLGNISLYGLLLAFSLQTFAQPPLDKISKLKAAYLFNFSKYITWPVDDSFGLKQDINLCVHASMTFEQFMQALVKNRRVGQYKKAVRVINLMQAQRCNVVYLQYTLDEPLPQLNNSLIVIDSDDVKQPGTAISFYQEQNKLRFEIDLDTIEILQVSVSSELLKLARIM